MNQRENIQNAINSLENLDSDGYPIHHLSIRTKAKINILRERIREIDIFDCSFSGSHYANVTDMELDDYLKQRGG